MPSATKSFFIPLHEGDEDNREPLRAILASILDGCSVEFEPKRSVDHIKLNSPVTVETSSVQSLVYTRGKDLTGALIVLAAPGQPLLEEENGNSKGTVIHFYCDPRSESQYKYKMDRWTGVDFNYNKETGGDTVYFYKERVVQGESYAHDAMTKNRTRGTQDPAIKSCRWWQAVGIGQNIALIPTYDMSDYPPETMTFEEFRAAQAADRDPSRGVIGSNLAVSGQQLLAASEANPPPLATDPHSVHSRMLLSNFLLSATEGVQDE
jgi:hypothetical protein